MLLKKKTLSNPVTPEEKALQERIRKAHWKLFPWTLLNIIPGILIGYFTWFYYFFVIMGDRIIWEREGFENILGFLLLYIAPVFSILGLISISVTLIAKFTYRPLIAKKFFEERKVVNNLWNTSVIVSVCTTVITIVIRRWMGM